MASSNKKARPLLTTAVDRSNSICESILDVIGETPIVRLNRVAAEAGLECEVVVKCEFFNAGGSVKGVLIS